MKKYEKDIITFEDIILSPEEKEELKKLERMVCETNQKIDGTVGTYMEYLDAAYEHLKFFDQHPEVVMPAHRFSISIDILKNRLFYQFYDSFCDKSLKLNNPELKEKHEFLMRIWGNMLERNF